MDGGLEWEGDGRHVGSYLDKLHAEFSEVGAGERVAELKGVKTLGVKRVETDDYADWPSCRLCCPSHAVV